MANITGAQNERVFQINKWLGLNQNPDGDTKLRMGEAALMRNWRVTRDGNLQKRPGTRPVLHVHDTDDVKEVWAGIVAGSEVILAMAGTKLFQCVPGSPWTKTEIGTIDAEHSDYGKPVHMFGFGGKLYLIAYGFYYSWDGTTFGKVTGYRPLVAVAIPPNGGGELLEGVNKLNGLRRCWISGDGSGTVFILPEGGTIKSDSVTVYDNATGSEVATGWSYADGKVTFTSAPAESANNYEIQWEVEETNYNDVVSKGFSEVFNGSQDTRVFLYGDGSANAIYSGLDYDGRPTAEYFPDLNQVQVGVANTPITGMIRQLSRLVCFKSDSAWVIQFGNITDAQGNVIAGFYVTPLNRSIGNLAMGQVQLVLNDPVSLFGQDIYSWKPNSYGNLTADERQAKRISDRVYEAARELSLVDCRAFDDNFNQELYIFNPGQEKALVWNYAADAWYCYENFPMYRPFSYHGELYYGSAYGDIQRVSTDYTYDIFNGSDPQAIDCLWQSGSMSFGADYQRKYAAAIWIGLKPESRSEVLVTVQTDKNSSYQEKVVGTELFGFDHIDFGDFSFSINRKPQMKRLKIKAKKFVFYKLVLKNQDEDISESAGQPSLDFSHTDFEHFTFAVEHKAFTGTSATITSVDMRVRFTGYAK